MNPRRGLVSAHAPETVDEALQLLRGVILEERALALSFLAERAPNDERAFRACVVARLGEIAEGLRRR